MSGRTSECQKCVLTFSLSPHWPADGENRCDVSHLLFHLDGGINWSGYLISPTFVEAITTSPHSSVSVLKEHFEKYLGLDSEMVLFVINNKS